MQGSGQAGFSLLGVLIAVMIMGIVATIAVPRFNGAIATANTAKIEADLSTLDSAIIVYEAEHGVPPSDLKMLDGYVNDVDKLAPPKGKCLLKEGGETAISGTAYQIKAGTGIAEHRATLDGHTLGEFGK